MSKFFDKNVKYIIFTLTYIFLLNLISGIAYAQDKAPAPFQNSNIERKLENGTLQKFDGNEYMIVKRGKVAPKVVNQAPVCPPEFICISKADMAERLAHTVKVMRAYNKEQAASKRKNRLSLLGGVGPDNDLSVSGLTPVSVRLDRSPIFGLQYQRKLNNRYNLGIMGISNESALISVGIDF